MLNGALGLTPDPSGERSSLGVPLPLVAHGERLVGAMAAHALAMSVCVCSMQGSAVCCTKEGKKPSNQDEQELDCEEKKERGHVGIVADDKVHPPKTSNHETVTSVAIAENKQIPADSIASKEANRKRRLSSNNKASVDSFSEDNGGSKKPVVVDELAGEERQQKTLPLTDSEGGDQHGRKDDSKKRKNNLVAGVVQAN